MAISLLEVQEAELRAAQAYRFGFSGVPVYRASPGCTHACPRCDIACAILHGVAADLRQKYDRQIKVPCIVFDTDAGIVTVGDV
jgi:hypothetical protein